MKKKKFFSRIFAAALAGAVAATTLVTNNGAGLLAHAAEDTTYSVKIISPDVPAGGSYSYNFYQIMAGDVQEIDGVNNIVNPEWGEALGGDKFDEVPEGQTPVGSMKSDADNAGIGYYPSSEVLFTALSGTMSCNPFPSPNTPLATSAREEYWKILESYGVKNIDNNYFNNTFKYGLKSDGGYTGNYGSAVTPRDVKGLAELLNKGLDDGTLRSADLKAFADLLLNGVEVEIQLDGDGNKESYKYEFITGEPQATAAVENDGTYTVSGLASGYYLVSCVDNTGELTNNGYESTMPIKPISAMLLMVGPANDGVTEIVGKNAYSVPTVTLDIYQKPVKLNNNDVNDIGTIIKAGEDDWKTTGSFDYYEDGNRQEAILYRIGITLPMNFDQYEDSGYFLAVLDQYSHYGSSQSGLYKEINRLKNVYPYVYVKHDSDYNSVGRLDSNIGKITNNYAAAPTLTGGFTTHTTFNENAALGFYADELFCLGDLYESKDSNEECNFKPGDTIYICYPAILNEQNVYVNENYLLNVNRIWAVYSNDPYANKLTNGDGGYSHVVFGEVGVTTIAEANVNTYSVKLSVDGINGYTDGAKFALYRNVTDGDATIKEYACLYYNTSGIGNLTYVKRWVPETEIIPGENETFEDALQNYIYSYGSTKNEGYVLSTVLSSSIDAGGVQIKGLAAGEYYLQELTISNKNPNHENITMKHYELAKDPIKFSVENEYNQNVNGYLGTAGNDENGNAIFETTGNGNSKTFISKLTVKFAQEKQEKAIDTYIIKPTGTDDEGNIVSVKNGSITTSLNEAEGSAAYATEDGKIEIQVYHNELHPFRLPQTGGIGTMIFFIVGGAIVTAAVVMIVTRLRVKRERL